MGLFAQLTHSDGRWRESEPDGEPYLFIDVFDSDIAAIEYRPAREASGRFYLGVEPRHYFPEEESASEPIDREAEAAGFARWLREVHGREVEPSAVLALMAPDVAPEEIEQSEESEESEGDVFVEETVDRLLDLIGLPLPEGMPS